ncbi:transferrin-binding protein-like solute binding protein [Sphingomonas elodea]|uniref:transferrin-binding protein-like solute binding protein n=1 Tax=Sphingomonas elodea TaxID=179878 RepID=UPI00026301CA|nr:transferrin-binding protein-like solute binding protein [Sphingomonas elodea]
MKTVGCASIVLAVLLGGCSGGGGGPGFITAPAGPSEQRNLSLTDVRFTEGFTGAGARIRYSVSGTGSAGGFDSGVPLSSNTLAVRYDASTQSYTIAMDQFTSAAFGPADRTSGSNTLTNYEKRVPGRQENLSLFNPGAGNPQLVLTYTSYGAYQSISEGSPIGVDTIFFAYGVRTVPSDMPKSGTATYTTRVDGQFAGTSGVYALGGDSNFTADFAAATVRATLQLRGQNVVTGGLREFGIHSLAGTIRSESVGVFFNAAGGSNGTTVNMQGTFYGPAAAEIGANFGMLNADGRGVGVLVGRRN